MIPPSPGWWSNGFIGLAHRVWAVQHWGAHPAWATTKESFISELLHRSRSQLHSSLIYRLYIVYIFLERDLWILNCLYFLGFIHFVSFLSLLQSRGSSSAAVTSRHAPAAAFLSLHLTTIANVTSEQLSALTFIPVYFPRLNYQKQNDSTKRERFLT